MNKSMRSGKTRARQHELEFKSWGGKRRGAGRKPKGERRGVSHRARPEIQAVQPVHVVVRVRSGLPSLRRDALRRTLERAFAAACERFGFRIVHYVILSNHLHLVVETEGKVSLARGMKGLLVRAAHALNRLLRRVGELFADRYFARALGTPREVRNVLVYVLRNGAHHGSRGAGIDQCTSGAWFDGWARALPLLVAPLLPTRARTWLLSQGWRKHGLIAFDEAPRCARHFVP